MELNDIRIETNQIHGSAKLKKDFHRWKKGEVGIITAYLPEDNIFAVMFEGNIPTGRNWITFKETEKEFKKTFKVILNV